MVTDTLRVMSMGIWVHACIEGCRSGLQRWTATCSAATPPSSVAPQSSASVLRPMRASPPPPSSAICTMLRASASILRHSAPTAPRLMIFTFCSSCLARRADSLHNLPLTKLHRSIKFVHSFTCSHCVGSRHLLLVVLRTFCNRRPHEAHNQCWYEIHLIRYWTMNIWKYRQLADWFYKIPALATVNWKISDPS